MCLLIRGDLAKVILKKTTPQKKIKYIHTRSLGALRAQTSGLWPFGPALGPSGLLDNVLHALRALRPCDPRNSAMMG